MTFFGDNQETSLSGRIMKARNVGLAQKVISQHHVKEFIKKLKEELLSSWLVLDGGVVKAEKYIENAIDKLAGDKLI